MSRILVETLGAKVEEVSASATLCDKDEMCNERCFSYLLHPQQSAAPQLLARWLSQWHLGKEQIKLWKKVSVLWRCYRSILVLLDLVVERVFADWMDQSRILHDLLRSIHHYYEKALQSQHWFGRGFSGHDVISSIQVPEGSFFVAAAPG